MRILVMICRSDRDLDWTRADDGDDVKDAGR